jgi:hypothetical protein
MKELNSKNIDQTARRIVKSSGLSESEVRTAVSSPYLFARIRAQIAADSSAVESPNIWAGLGIAARTAIPGMTLVAAISFGFLLYENGNKTTTPAFSVDAYLDSGDSGFDRLLSVERHPLTTEEVLNSIVNKDDREAVK